MDIFKKDEKIEGYPLPPPIPRPYNLASSQHTYISQLELPLFSNEPVQHITARNILNYINIPSMYTALLCNVRQDGIKAIGSAVIISQDTALIARHCVNDIQGYIRLRLYFNNDMRDFVDIASIEHDPYGLDLSKIMLKQRINSSVNFIDIAFEEQPSGRYFMIHYAGGNIKQFSTGDFIGSPTWSYAPYDIFIAGGPLASGAGIFNIKGQLIGINVYRSNEYGQQSRKVVLLSQSGLFSHIPFNLPAPGSIVRRYCSPTSSAGNLSLNLQSGKYNRPCTFSPHFECYSGFGYPSVVSEFNDGYETYTKAELLSLSETQKRGLSRPERERLEQFIREEIDNKKRYIQQLLQVADSPNYYPFTEDFKKNIYIMGHHQNKTRP